MVAVLWVTTAIISHVNTLFSTGLRDFW